MSSKTGIIGLLIIGLAGTALAQEDRAARVSPGTAQQAIPLLPPAKAAASANATSPAASGQSSQRAITTVVGSLAVCLGIFLLAAWVLRKQSPSGLQRLPVEVLESLGRAPLAGRQQLQLIRLGRKLILLDVTPTGAEALAEITDPAEVDRLVGLCQQTRPNSVTSSFRQVLAEAEAEPTTPGFLGTGSARDWGGEQRPVRRRPSLRGGSA